MSRWGKERDHAHKTTSTFQATANVRISTAHKEPGAGHQRNGLLLKEEISRRTVSVPGEHPRACFEEGIYHHS